MPPLSQSESRSHRTESSALEIPEVLHAIAVLLDPSSLVTATQVSRLWHDCCSPVLWGSITFQDWARPGFSPHQLYAHADLVRTLEWCHTQPSTSSATVTTRITPESLERFMQPPPHELLLDRMSLASDPRAKRTHASSSTAHHSDETLPQHYDTVLAFTAFEAPAEERLSFACLNRLVGQCTNLHRLCLQGGKEGIHGDMASAVHSLAFLQELELSASRIVMDGEARPPTVQDWIRGMDQLRSLSIRGTAFSFDRRIVPRPSSSTMLVTPPPGPLVQPTFPIRHLTLDTPALMNETCLSHLIQQFPLLESLNLPGGLAWNWSDAFITHLARSCPRLHSFTINSASFPSVPEDRLTALILGLCAATLDDGDAASEGSQRSLRKFGARSCFVGDSTLWALQHHCPDLEVLDISLTRGQGLSKGGLYDYLMQARNLRHLEAEGVWIVLQDVHQANLHVSQGEGEGEEEESVQTDDAHGQDEQHQQQQQPVHQPQQPELQQPEPQQQPQQQQQQHQSLHEQQTLSQQHVARPSCREWASRSTLQHLNIGFTSPDRSTRQCCHMYSLLATLTHLEYLQLSYTCLNLSADSGFHQLQSLTRLRVLSIETCGYSSLSREDLVWMVQTWPKLERIFVNLPGGTKDRQFRAWLKEVGRDDVAIESQQALMYY
ncbi:unnamed protein product [Mortierella alpina]